MAETHYILPSHPTVLCEDRFSILDSDELYVPFWAALTTLLNTTELNSPAALIDILETISVIRRGRADSDYGFLREHLQASERREEFFDRVWPALKDLALDMPNLFPDSRLPILGCAQERLILSKRQVACLVIHQFLCTLTAPTWQDGYQDFHIWYSSEQPHAKVVDAYLTGLLEYFFTLTDTTETSPLSYAVDDWQITYSLHSDIALPDLNRPHSIPLSNLTVLNFPEATTSPSVLGLSGRAEVISANKYIGFGRTGTQEEVHVGSSPECCPAVLVTPPLQDDQVLVVTGPEAKVTIGGYGREARNLGIWRQHHTVSSEEHCRPWKERNMLFMDALELDLVDREKGLPDFQPGNVDRELRKACTAFSSYKKYNKSAYTIIFTGYWGCGTFGGNVGVKSLIQWCAASLAGCELHFLCFGEVHGVFGDELLRFVRDVKDKSSATDIIDVLRQFKPEDVSTSDSVLSLVKRKIV